MMHARHCAVRSTALFGEELAANVGDRVLLQRYGGIATLLRAVVHQSVFADVEVTRSGAAAPLVGPAVGNVVLEPVEARVMVLLELLHLQEDIALDLAQRLELSFAVMNDADGRSEAELHGA